MLSPWGVEMTSVSLGGSELLKMFRGEIFEWIPLMVSIQLTAKWGELNLAFMIFPAFSSHQLSNLYRQDPKVSYPISLENLLDFIRNKGRPETPGRMDALLSSWELGSLDSRLRSTR